jgi:Ca2+:H+ antiporter
MSFDHLYNIPTILLQVVAVTAEWLVDSIDGMTSSGNISKEFVGIILLPIVGNAAGTRFAAY